MEILLSSLAAAARDPLRLASGDIAGAVEMTREWVASIATDIKTMQEEE